MNILIQGSIIGLTACLNLGAKPFLQPSGNYVGCYVDRATYARIMGSPNKTITTLKP